MILAASSPRPESLYSKALMARDVRDVPADLKSDTQPSSSLSLCVLKRCRTDLLNLTRPFQDHIAGCSPDS